MTTHRRPFGDSHEGFPGLKAESGNFAITGGDRTPPPKDGSSGMLPTPPRYESPGGEPGMSPTDEFGYCEPGTGDGSMLPIDVDGRGLGSGPQG